MVQATEQKTMVPELRFSEFDDEWSKLKLQVLINSMDSGWSPNCEESKAELSEWGVLKTSSVVWGGYDESANKKLPDKLSVRYNLEVKKGDILVTRAGPVDRVGVVAFVGKTRANLMISDKIIRIKANENNDSNFLSRLISGWQAQKYLQARKSGLAQAQANISQDILNRMTLVLPEKKEQQKIARFLMAVDDKLTLLRQKRDGLQRYKRGVMQQLFSQQIRFRQDDGSAFPDWEEKVIHEYIVKHDEKTTYTNQYPVLTSSRKGLFFQTDYYKGQVASEDNTGYNVVPYGYFTYRHMSDDLVFKFNRNTICEKGIVSTLYPVFTTRNINAEFLQVKLNEGNEFKRFAILQKQGGSRTYMYLNKLVNLKLLLPCKEEQDQIVELLSSLDKKLELLESKLADTETFKKGLLQKMFV